MSELQYGAIVTSSSSPPMLRRRLGAELRRLREATGRHLGDVAGELRWSESKLSRIETGHNNIRSNDLGRLLDIYGIGNPDRSRLNTLAANARQRAWWEAYVDELPDAYEVFIGFEAEASSILSYEAQLVPGLLQTAEYAHAVIQAEGILHDPDLVQQRIAVRMARQSVLTREPLLDLRVVLDEAAIRRQIGGQDVLRRQLRRLAEASERPMTTVQVLPFAVGGHRALAGSFVVLEFDSETDSPLVYAEGATGGVFRSKSNEVESYRERFAALAAAALSPADSGKMIAAASRG